MEYLMMNERFEQIKAILLKERQVKVADLSNRLSVSEVTIRKDLAELEKLGFLLRRYGGAILAENPQQIISYLRKLNVQSEEKTIIAKMAASMIRDGENLILDAGSTTLTLARELRGRKARIVTNSLAIADELLDIPEILVEVTGGSLRKTSGALIGSWACKILEEVRVDKVFLGCSGFDPERGFSSENAVEAETKRKMLSCGGEKIILADHTKFARPAFANFAALNEIDTLITDKKLPGNITNILRKNGIKIKVAKGE